MQDESREKKKEYDRQYQQKNTRLFSFRLNRLNPVEAQLIEKLEKCGNASKVVKAALMQQMYM